MSAPAKLSELNIVMRELAHNIRSVANATRDTARKNRGHRDAPSMMQMAELYDGWAGIIEANTDAIATLVEPGEVNPDEADNAKAADSAALAMIGMGYAWDGVCWYQATPLEGHVAERHEGNCPECGTRCNVERRLHYDQHLGTQSRTYYLPLSSRASAGEGGLDGLNFDPDERHQVADMANVGYALMQTIARNLPGYVWNECPSEIVCDLMNLRGEILTAAPQPAQTQGEEKRPTHAEVGLGTFLMPAQLHPATATLVSHFAGALAAKLAKAERKYGYSDGWASPDWMDECRTKLLEHVAKGDPRDVAAYCAFLWHHGERTALTATSQPAAAHGEDSLRKALEEIRDYEGDPNTPVKNSVKKSAIARAALAAAPQPQTFKSASESCKSDPAHGDGEVDYAAKWFAECRRVLEDVATEMRATGRGDTRFRRLIESMPRQRSTRPAPEAQKERDAP